MAEYKRISPKGIDTLVENPDELTALGYVWFTITHSPRSIDSLEMYFPDEKRYINLYNSPPLSRETFLRAVDEYLSANWMYVADSRLSPQRFKGLIPFKLDGKLYQEKQPE